jgi:hypothetical protein
MTRQPADDADANSMPHAACDDTGVRRWPHKKAMSPQCCPHSGSVTAPPRAENTKGDLENPGMERTALATVNLPSVPFLAQRL